MRIIICVALALLLAGPAAAQDFFDFPIPGVTQPQAAASLLTKAEGGKVTLGQCYSACADLYNETAIFLVLNLDEAGTEGQQCYVAQSVLRTLDACAAGCSDVERIFGTIDSQARASFNHLVDHLRGPIETSGLWKTHDDYAPLGTAQFTISCTSFIEACDDGGLLCP